MYTVAASGSGAWLGPPAGTHWLIMLWLSQSRGGDTQSVRASAGQASDVVTLCLLSSWP